MPQQPDDIDVEVVDQTPSTSMVPAGDFRLRPVMSVAEAKAALTEVQQFVAHILVPEEDYGVIPGTNDKRTLFQAGAEKLIEFFGMRPEFEIHARTESWGDRSLPEDDPDHHPFFDYTVRCTLYDRRTGVMLGDALASCNCRESRYFWRTAELTCPECGKPKIIKGKEEYGGGWLCWAKKGGCGAKYDDKDPRITGQSVGRQINPDLADTKNTILQIAEKRAEVRAVRTITRISAQYTQDVEDGIVHGAVVDEPPPPTPTPDPPKQRRQSRAKAKPKEADTDTPTDGLGTKVASKTGPTPESTPTGDVIDTTGVRQLRTIARAQGYIVDDNPALLLTMLGAEFGLAIDALEEVPKAQLNTILDFLRKNPASTWRQ